MKNKAFIGAIAASLLPGQAAMAQNKVVKATADRPNIIFILADDLGYGDLSCYGSKTIKTPNIDKLAATGTRFNQSYAGSGISSPSRCALMTGKNTGNSRIRDNMCTAGGLTGLKINPNGDTTIVRRISSSETRRILSSSIWLLMRLMNPTSSTTPHGMMMNHGA